MYHPNIYYYAVFKLIQSVYKGNTFLVNSELYIVRSAFGFWWGKTRSRAGWSFWNLLINGAGGSIQIGLL